MTSVQPQATFQVVNAKTMSGTSKANNPYHMLIVSGIFTSEDGEVEVGEITFMMGRDRASFPQAIPGQKYVPVIKAQARQGKLEFKIDDLKPLAALSKAA